MVKRQKLNLLCKLGLHKWRYYGESVVIARKEYAPPYKGRVLYPRLTTRDLRFIPRPQSKEALTKRKCLRCGISMKRILVKNADGTLSCIGWDPLLQPKYEKDEEPERITTRRKMIR
jgi:hypothetical protein